MRIAVIVPDRPALASAGVRIRYRRLASALERLGHRLVLQTIDRLGARGPFWSDAYLFCKCHDPRSVILAHALRQAGRLVGIDVFDDYFSQAQDRRLAPMRRWLQEMRPLLHFALCATPAMAARLGTLAPDLRVHVLRDPSGPFDEKGAAAAIERKAAAARRGGAVEVAWFGMGDNPHFPVGIEDLAAWSDSLVSLRSAGLSPRLSVLTNRRALTPARLEAVARLPLPTRLEEWSLEREAALLDRSLVAFLPVNAQPFSTAKSPNRAITALTAGAQVLTAGFPLYEAVDRLLYRSGAELASDLLGDRLRLRRATLPALAQHLRREGAPETEAAGLSALLAEASRPPAQAVIQGADSDRSVHDVARRAGGLLVASPFADPDLPCDLRFRREANGSLSAILSDRACDRLGAADRPRLEAFPPASGQSLQRLDLGTLPLPGLDARGSAERLAFYAAGMVATRALVRRLLPGVAPVVSESAPPFSDAPVDPSPGSGRPA